METQKTYLELLEEKLEQAQKTYISLFSQSNTLTVIAAKYLAVAECWQLRAEIAHAKEKYDDKMNFWDCHNQALAAFQIFQIGNDDDKLEQLLKKARSKKS